MSLSITTTRSELLTEARAEFTRQAERNALVTGEKPQSVPVDSVLIASDPTLSQAIQAADATPVTTDGGSSMAGGAVGGAQASSSSSGNSTPTISSGNGTSTETGAGTATASGAQSGQLLNLVA